jgi:hypothetical protein
LSGWPSWAHALAAMTICAIGFAAVWGCAKSSDTPLVRHVLNVCDPLSCQRCQDKARDRRVSDYARQARERRAERAAGA